MAIRLVQRAEAPEQHPIRARVIRQFQQRDARVAVDRAIALLGRGDVDRAKAELGQASMLLAPEASEATGALIDDAPAVLTDTLTGMRLVRLGLQADDHEAIGEGCRIVLAGMDWLMACMALRAR